MLVISSISSKTVAVFVHNIFVNHYCTPLYIYICSLLKIHNDVYTGKISFETVILDAYSLTFKCIEFGEHFTSF